MKYDAATGTTTNITNDENAIASNQRIADNGDVVWENYDFNTYLEGIKYYKASDGSITELTPSMHNFYFGAGGHTAWVTASSGSYTITSYDPATGTSSDIITEATTYTPYLTGVSARGDITWRPIIGTSWQSRVYNAQTNAIVTLSNTTGSGAYELVLGDNGDVMWSLWDGTDFEVHSYQGDSGTITDLSNNSVDDGVAQVNAKGTILWHRWDPTDDELMMAQRNAGIDMPIDVKNVELDVDEGEVHLTTKFTLDTLPAAGDMISVTLDGITLVNQPLSAFTARGNSVYQYEVDGTHVQINFTSGTLVVETSGVDLSAIAANSTAEVGVSMGSASGSDTYTFGD